MSLKTNTNFYELDAEDCSFYQDVICGLSQQPKTLAPKYFYDRRGSQLFDMICTTDEYYPTRTESLILATHGEDMLQSLPGPIALIELGSGSSIKTRYLLEASPEISTYLPIDISKEHLLASTLALAELFPSVDMTPICADYTRLAFLPATLDLDESTALVFFPGSTIGNLDEVESLEMLKMISQLVKSQGFLLLGIDLLKDPSILEIAYNDAAGYTAAFNLNLLRRINSDLNANFNLTYFEHEAFFNPIRQRIEMHLRSRRQQMVNVGDHTFSFERGERIHTESSYKYDLESFAEFVQQAGFKLVRTWTDANHYFAVVLLKTNELTIYSDQRSSLS